MTDLVRDTLRLRPDRIIIGEVRDGSALDLLKAWNTGHPGGLATIHANSAAEALTRLEDLIGEVTQRIPHTGLSLRPSTSWFSLSAPRSGRSVKRSQSRVVGHDAERLSASSLRRRPVGLSGVRNGDLPFQHRGSETNRGKKRCGRPRHGAPIRSYLIIGWVRTANMPKGQTRLFSKRSSLRRSHRITC